MKHAYAYSLKRPRIIGEQLFSYVVLSTDIYSVVSSTLSAGAEIISGSANVLEDTTVHMEIIYSFLPSFS